MIRPSSWASTQVFLYPALIIRYNFKLPFGSKFLEVTPMLGNLRLIKYITIALALTIFIGSCSGGELAILPGGYSTPAGGRAPQAGIHRCLGLYDIYISADRTVWEVYPHRTGMAHLNIIPLLEGKTDFLTIPEDGIQFLPDYIEATVEIQHPLESIGDFDANFFTGFDVKGIVMFPGTFTFPASQVITQDPNKGEGRVLNAHGHSRWWNPVEFTGTGFLQEYVEGKLALPPGGTPLVNATLHPFRYIFPPANAKRQGFPSGKKAQTTYQMLIPEPGEPFAIMYAIDASYGEPTLNVGDEEIKPKHFEMTANQPEPFNMSVYITNNTMWGDGIYEGGGTFDIEVEIFDWQDPRWVENITDKDRGLDSVYIEVPGIFADRIGLTPVTGNPPVVNGETTTAVVEGALEAGELVINDIVVSYTTTPAENTSYENATHIRDAINGIEELPITAKAKKDDPELGRINLKYDYAGPQYAIRIQDTPNLPQLGFNTFDTAVYEYESTPPPPGYWVIENGRHNLMWSKTQIANSLTITPGDYPMLIAALDYETDPLFLGEENHVTAYKLLTIPVSETIPELCELIPAVHNEDLGTGTIANAKQEWKADCDFIGYVGSPYTGRLLFNKKSDLPDGVQEICVMHVDEPQTASALTIITIADETKGVPLILQEDEVTGNIIIVNHTQQDEVLVYSASCEFLGSFDVGTGDDGYNSPIAVDFDDEGNMWMVSHRGSAGPELRQWHHYGEGVYVNVESARLDLVPFFGTGYIIYDLKVMPTENLVIIFAGDQMGHVEFFDVSAVPTVHLPGRTITNLFDTPLAPAGYPGLRITVGGDLMLDRMGDPETVRCRIVAAANIITGPVALSKFDFYANILNQSAFPGAVICLAMNNDPLEHRRHIVAFPLSETNKYRVFGVPLSQW
jgi:hypothetical protein